jgi:hypothetical protein
MTIKPTYFVSFPRSGHHWTMGMLYNYFQKNIHYCETYDHPELRMTICAKTNIEKTHDFDLAVNPAGRQVIVLLRRHAHAAMLSWYRSLNAVEPFEEFLTVHEDYWLKFLERWTKPVRPGEPRLIFWFEDVEANPVSYLATLVRFLCDEPVDNDKVRTAVKLNLNWKLMERHQSE